MCSLLDTHQEEEGNSSHVGGRDSAFVFVLSFAFAQRAAVCCVSVCCCVIVIVKMELKTKN